MFKLDLEEAEEPEIKLPTFIGSSKNQGFQKNIYFCLIDYAKALDCVDHHKLWKILKEMGILDHLTWLLRNLYAGPLEPDMEQQISSKLGKEYDKVVYCHPAYLTYMHAEYIMQNARLDESHWNQGSKEKYQQLQICRWYHSNNRK